jgi:hypothetical protein
MEIFTSIKEKLFGKALETPALEIGMMNTIIPGDVKTTQEDVTSAPSLESEVAATLGGANAEPASMRRPDPVDVAVILDEAVKQNGQKLDWRHSIVDMMKALGMDASLQERKELADELGYTGDTSDSVSMNIWLHKALMTALAANGGKVPPKLLD